MVQVLAWAVGCRHTFLITCRTQHNDVVELYCDVEETVHEMCMHDWVHVTTTVIDGRLWIIAVVTVN